MIRLIRKTKLTSIEVERVLSIRNSFLPQSAFITPETFEKQIHSENDPEFILVMTRTVIVGFALIRTINKQRWVVLSFDLTLNYRGLADLLIKEIKRTNKHFHGWVYRGKHRKDGRGKNYNSPINTFIKAGGIVKHKRTPATGDDPEIIQMTYEEKSQSKK
jgi:hypothetical protein